MNLPITDGNFNKKYRLPFKGDMEGEFQKTMPSPPGFDPPEGQCYFVSWDFQ